MKGRDEIKELFSEKLGNYEAKVNPELWTNIASQIGAATVTTAASTGISLLTKWIIGASIASAVAVTAIIIVNNSEKPISNKTPKVENVAENNSSNQETVNTSDEAILEKNTITKLDSSPKEERVIKKQNWDDIVLDDLVPEGKKVNNEIKTPTNGKEPSIETEGVKKKEPSVTPAVDPEKKEEEIIVEDIVVENQTQDEPEATYKIGKLPNTFSPNRDGVHDLFFVESEGLTEFNIVILDAKNNIVFKSNDPEFEWDGNDLSGYPVPDGSNNRYVYFITARDQNGSPINKGNMLIITR